MREMTHQQKLQMSLFLERDGRIKPWVAMTTREAKPLVARGLLQQVSGQGKGMGNSKLWACTEAGRELARRIQYVDRTYVIV